MVDVVCFDKDVFTADDFVAECHIPMEIMFRKKKGQQWFKMVRKGGKNGGELLLDWEYKMKNMGGYKAPNNGIQAHNQQY